MNIVVSYLECRICGWESIDDGNTFKCPICKATHLREIISYEKEKENKCHSMKII